MWDIERHMENDVNYRVQNKFGFIRPDKNGKTDVLISKNIAKFRSWKTWRRHKERPWKFKTSRV